MRIREHTESSFYGGTLQAVAHCMRNLPVSLPISLDLEHNSQCIPPAGNTSLRLSMSGASFGDVAPIAGQYGTVYLISSYPVIRSPQADLFVGCSIGLLPCASVRPLDCSTRIYHL